MPQRYSQKVTNTFVKGLITEASEMTFPENASSDELNCDLLKNGARRRRKGLVFEDNYQLSSFTVSAGDFVHSETWYNVSGLSGVEFLVVQKNNMIYFYDKSAQAVSATEKSFSINLYDYDVANDYDAADEPISTSSINGYLIITSAAINPLRVKYTASTDSISVTAITIKIRDLEYVYTGTVQSDDPPELAALGGSTSATDFINYKYDLLNMGWSSDNNGRSGTAFEYWDSQRSDYPPRNASWWIGKNSDGNQDIGTFEKVDAGNTLAPNGHYILDFFSKNRSSASGVSGIATVTETARFRATAAYAGRIWYAGLDSSTNGGKIFFSKVIEDETDFGKCYNVADPTAEDTAGVIASDGGYLSIPDAANIRVLFPSGSLLYVFAQNGIWAVGGVDNVFKANEFFVKKISNFGLYSQRTLVNALGTPIFWDTSGIYTITAGDKGEGLQLISESIKTYFDAIPNNKKLEATAVFDRISKRVYWMFPSSTETVAHKFNEILVLDLQLEAYFPWRISDATGTTPYLMGGFFLSGFGSTQTEYNVLSGADQVIDVSSNTVVQTLSAESGIVSSDIKFLVKTSNNKLTVAEFTGDEFLDWGSANFSSYAETGYDFMGDASIRKNNPYITTYMRRTEQNFVLVDEEYEPDFPSSCLLTVKWDLSRDSSRWSEPMQIYRLVNYPIPDPNDLTFNYPYDTIVSRTKIRGKGRVLRMRFESEQGKDFYLIGWESIVASNPRF